MKKFKHKKTGEIATYKDGCFKKGNCVVEIGVEPSSEFWEEILDLPVGTKVKDTHTNVIYTKDSETKWNSLTWKENIIPTCVIGEGKRFQIVEEEVKKDYEILSFITNNNLFVKKNNTNLFYITNPNVTKAQIEVISEQEALWFYFKIHSVKRLSDGEVFSIGDKVNRTLIYNPCETIVGFELNNNNLTIICSNGRVNSISKSVINKVKPTLFTTEDGVDIREGDIYYYIVISKLEILEPWILKKHKAEWSKPNVVPLGKVQFSSKEAAQNWLILNKPCLSYNEVIQWYNKLYFEADVYPKLKELVKSKL